jgi:hypothetical protein
MSRYGHRRIVVLTSEEYSEQFEKRGVTSIRLHAQKPWRYPTEKEIAQLTLVPHIWRDGDRYFNLAKEHYISEKDWWIIAAFNKKPTEALVNVGDVIYIPKPLERIRSFLET